MASHPPKGGRFLKGYDKPRLMGVAIAIDTFQVVFHYSPGKTQIMKKLPRKSWKSQNFLANVHPDPWGNSLHFDASHSFHSWLKWSNHLSHLSHQQPAGKGEAFALSKTTHQSLSAPQSQFLGCDGFPWELGDLWTPETFHVRKEQKHLG